MNFITISLYIYNIFFNDPFIYFMEQLEKQRRADQELKKRVLKLEFCLQEARAQTRKLQRVMLISCFISKVGLLVMSSLLMLFLKYLNICFASELKMLGLLICLDPCLNFPFNGLDPLCKLAHFLCGITHAY